MTDPHSIDRIAAGNRINALETFTEGRFTPKRLFLAANTAGSAIELPTMPLTMAECKECKTYNRPPGY